MSPYIFVAGVQLYVYTLSCLVVNCIKTRVVPSLPPVVLVADTSFFSDSTHAYKNFWGLLGLAVRRLFFHSFIHLFIFSVSIFYEPFNYVTQIDESVQILWTFGLHLFTVNFAISTGLCFFLQLEFILSFLLQYCVWLNTYPKWLQPLHYQQTEW